MATVLDKFRAKGGLEIPGSTSGLAQIVAPAAAGTPTLTLPTSSGTFELTGHTHAGSAITSGTVSATYIDSAIARLAGPTFTGTVTLPTGTTKVGQTTLAQGVNGTITFPASAGTLSLDGHTHSYAPTVHTHAATDTTSGTFDIARIPTGSTGTTVSLGNHTHSYQPLDADLTAIAALAGTSGLLKKTAADTWTLDTSTYLTSNQTITLSGDASGSGTTSITVTVSDDSHSHTGTTISTLDASDVTTGTFNIARIPTGSTGTTVSLGNHTHSYQPLDADLTAIAALAGTSGLLKKTAADTWTLDTTAYTTNTGTVTSVSMTVPTGLSISGTPITSSGTLALTLTAGYEIPQSSAIVHIAGTETISGAKTFSATTEIPDMRSVSEIMGAF